MAKKQYKTKAMHEKETKYMSVQECAEYLHLSQAMIYKLTYEKSIPFIRVGNRKLFRKDILDGYFEGSLNG